MPSLENVSDVFMSSVIIPAVSAEDALHDVAEAFLAGAQAANEYGWSSNSKHIEKMATGTSLC